MEREETNNSDILRELIIINNERFDGYKTAARETNDAAFKALFAEFSLQSKRFRDELRQLIPINEESPANDETKLFSDFYQSWMKMKTALGENNNNAILATCEIGEDIIKKNYDDIIKNASFSDKILAVLKKQKKELEKSYDLIKLKQY